MTRELGSGGWWRRINEAHADAALCVITGDLTDRGDVESYRACADITRDLKIPCRLMLGNHDNRQNFEQVFPDAPTDGNGFVQSTLDLPDVRLVFLDTLDDNDPGEGQLDVMRLNWLDTALDEAELASRKSIVFMHHPPFPVGMRVVDDLLVRDPEAFLRRLKERRSIKHLVFGHLHLTVSGSWKGTSYSCNRSVAHRIALDLESNVTTFIDSDPSFDVMLISDTGIAVHQTAPIAKGTVIAREFATPDGRGRIEMM